MKTIFDNIYNRTRVARNLVMGRAMLRVLDPIVSVTNSI
jgi:hypothetical protein